MELIKHSTITKILLQILAEIFYFYKILTLALFHQVSVDYWLVACWHGKSCFYLQTHVNHTWLQL